MKPLISICIPTYNGAAFLQEALDSVVAQTYEHIEVIISDDQSQDGTIEILERFRESVTFPVAIYSHIPEGIGANWNHTVEKANGAYIKFLFQDDVLKPTCIEEMVSVALRDPSIVLVYSRREIIYDSHATIHPNWKGDFLNLHTHWASFKIEGDHIIDGSLMLKDRNLLNHPENKIGEPPATLLKRSAMDLAGPFNTALRQSLDIEYWYRLLVYGKAAFIDQELIQFRLHDEQTSAVNDINGVHDKYELEKYLSKHIFWKLHPVFQKEILYRHYYLGRFWKRIKRIFTPTL